MNHMTWRPSYPLCMGLNQFLIKLRQGVLAELGGDEHQHYREDRR
jgi:hypothetical protein